ncbi:DeoR/GlpR family DNA-binding transcription regulator [Halomonas sp. NyZ770]|uniref:DeoR/GlpR family DNA-binding transcription regulator n=1 Tax=Halomonas sp. NyZ770 TaxID=2883106 RepID=UPI001D0AA8C7|nr:DeoR/GlpR family DNA-binding transcription regulator [Halomonas sp. NyZ770]UDM08597.1 DeoR/GlpR family DNA-binding transcription regulator [Halomonas sp. NyZ770]
MKVAKRRSAMLEAVHSGITDVETLCERFNISEATVRRDLSSLADEGHIVRTYGGAAAVVGKREPELSLMQRQHERGDVKARLALAALEHIEDGDTLLLEGGSTTTALAKLLGQRRGLHVFTNNLAALPALAAIRDCKVSFLGGDLRVSSMTTYGVTAQAALERLSVNKLFMSADGVVADLGLCEASAEQAYLKEIMIRRALSVYVLADSSKLGSARQQHWTPMLSQWTLITDDQAGEDRLEAFKRRRAVTLEVIKL